MTSWWTLCRLKSPASRLFNQSFIQAQIKENVTAPRHWWPMDSPHKWPSNAENVSIWWRHHANKNPPGYNSMPGRHIAKTVYICQDSTAIVTCAMICSYRFVRIWRLARIHPHRNWIVIEESFVKRVPMPAFCPWPKVFTKERRRYMYICTYLP